MLKRTHEPGKLAAVTLKKLTDGWHADGGNLYLFVRGTSRTWVFRYVSLDGKRRNMGLGSIESTSLSRARELAKANRSAVRDKQTPVDPITQAKTQKAARKAAEQRSITFKACAEAVMKSKGQEWRNPKHGQQWKNTLESYAYPILGSLPVGMIDTPLIIKCLEPIWTEKTETASRVRGRIESVLDWATVSGYRQGDNPARWRGHLDHILPSNKKISRVNHHPALPFAQIAAFMVELRKREGNGARALEFLILTAARSGEIRGARWSEIDLTENLWIIPADRMKAQKEHRVPLSDAAVQILKALSAGKSDEYVFPSIQKGKQLSDMTLSAVMKRLNKSDFTVHGFRSSFRDWASEKTNHSSEVIEMALAHTIQSAVEAAYRRGDLLEKRRELMDDWARYCDALPSQNNVISINRQVGT